METGTGTGAGGRTDVDVALRAGVALFAVGDYHAAHEPWEAVWLDADAGTDDHRLLQGLIQYAAALHHARDRNWSGATGLAGSARDYLADVPDGFRGVNVVAIGRFLARLEADPERVERGQPTPITLDGRPFGRDELADDPAAAALAARAVADEDDRYDRDVVAHAVDYAREEADEGATGRRFLALVADFAGDPAARDLVYRRLASHVERRRARERDVEGLFD